MSVGLSVDKPVGLSSKNYAKKEIKYKIFSDWLSMDISVFFKVQSWNFILSTRVGFDTKMYLVHHPPTRNSMSAT